MLTFTIAQAGHAERTLTLNQDDLVGEGATLGRASRNQVVLEDPGISRIHARLSLKEGSLFISDCGSTAGTTLNGSRLASNQPARLAEGDRIVIGPFTLGVGATSTGGDSLRTTIMADPPAKSYMPLAGLSAEAYRRWSNGEIVVRVVRIIEETHDVKTFVFACEQPTLFVYEPGQFVTLHLTIDGKPITRSYSISSSPSRPHSFSITVKRVEASDGQPAGVVSSHLHTSIAVGDTVTVSGPHGTFSCARHPSPRLLLVSAGSGITPMLSMARWLSDTSSEADVVFLHSARTSADIICRRDLELLAVHNPRLRLVIATTRPEPGVNWIGFTGRISGEMLGLAVPDYLRRTVFCCGPEPFMRGVKELLISRSFPANQYHEESFGAPRRTAAQPSTAAYGLKAVLKQADSGAHQAVSSGSGPTHSGQASGSRPTGPVTAAVSAAATLTLAKSGKTARCQPGQTLLEAAESAGATLPFGCRMGKCGACKQRKRSGSLSSDGYDDSVLSPTDRNAGCVLTCIGKAAGDVVLEA